MNKKRMIIIVIIVIAMIVGIFGIVKVVPRYNNPYSEVNISDKVGLIVGQNNRTNDIIDEIVIKDGKILFSFDNMKRFIDAYILKDEKYNQIITNSKTSTKVIDVNNKKMREFVETKNNWEDIYIETIGDKIYFDIAQLKEIYNIDVSYIEKTNLVKISKDIHTYEIGSISKTTKIKYLPSSISATIDKLEANSQIYILKKDKNYYKVLDSMGRFGYVKQSDVAQIQEVTKYNPKKYDEKINLVWEYVYLTSPDRGGQSKLEGVNILSPTWIDLLDENGNIQNKVDTTYLSWAKNTGYDVWVLFSNNSKIDSTHNILNDSKLRQKVIQNVLDICLVNNLEGINIDFEYMYKEDKDMFSQFVRELAVAFHKHDIFVSVDVTVPDGSERWSLCFDRSALGEAVDYIMLMAYDQTPGSSTVAGSIASSNWIKKNIEKLLNEVANDKLILGMPLYTRAWVITNGVAKSSVVNMKDVQAYIDKYLTSNYEKTWLEEEGQYYITDTQGNKLYCMWIEDIKSIEEKLKLFKQYDLAGVATWEKDREDSGIWNLISKYL